jgi:putative glutamine amidotransferase
MPLLRLSSPCFCGYPERKMAARVGISDCGEAKIAPYENAIRSVGLDPHVLTVGGHRNLDGLNGLLLTGGTDINPRRYGQEPVPETQQPNDERDELEFALLGEALALDLPVFAICRGMQLLNVHLHGTLTQHLASEATHVRRLKDEVPGQHRAAHSVEVLPGTLLARIIGAGRHDVNSRHHQGVHDLARAAVKSAVSEDGITEGMELPGKRFVLAVQWHPEDRIEISEADRKLFEAFAASARGCIR